MRVGVAGVTTDPGLTWRLAMVVTTTDQWCNVHSTHQYTLG